MVKVHFFGTSAAAPNPRRGFACIGLNCGERVTLLDCGDGSIHKLVREGADITSISDILISHYHSDHVTGLTSIIETMAIKKKTTKLSVYGPVGLKDYFSTIQRITNVAFNRKFELELVELLPNQSISTQDFEVTAFEMDHTLPCAGYRLVRDGSVISYTGDTQPCLGLDQLAADSDLLIHEATYLQKEIENMKAQKHSSPDQAAKVASSSHSRRLILTHVNDSHETPEEMLAETAPIFKNSFVAFDGFEFELER